METDFLIVIPSKSRAKELFNDTYSFVKHSKYPFKIFVEPSQYENYLKYIPKKDLVVLDKDNQGLCYAKLFIQKYLQKRNILYCMKLDDDLVNVRVPETRGDRTIKVERSFRVKTAFDNLINNSIKLLKDFTDIKAIQIDYGNKLIDYDETKTFTTINSRLLSSYIVTTDYLFPHNEHIFADVFEDFDVFMRIINDGYYTVRYGLTGFDYRPVGLNKGGHQDFNRTKACENAKKRMEVWYPNLAWKQVDKIWKFEPDISKTIKGISIHAKTKIS